MKVIQIRLNAVEEQMLKEVQKRNKTCKDREALLRRQIMLISKTDLEAL